MICSLFSVQGDAEVAAESERMLHAQQAFAASADGQAWAERRAALPVLQVKDGLLQALTDGHTAVLSGDTGCGKTTQVHSPTINACIAQMPALRLVCNMRWHQHLASQGQPHKDFTQA